MTLGADQQNNNHTTVQTVTLKINFSNRLKLNKEVT